MAQAINRAIFNKSLSVFALRAPVVQLNNLRKKLKRCMFQRPKVRNVLEDPKDPSGRVTKLLVLSESVEDTELTGLEPELRSQVAALGLDVVPCEVQLTYEHFSVEECLRQLLPAGVEIISAFESVGHIAHLNLRDHLLPHKHTIAQVILEKNPNIRTVVNKTSTIATQFREFPMEVLAGEDDFMATVKEHGFTFRFDYSKVYWNSRLDTEHHRLVNKFKPTDVICDMFAGVGPFALPAAGKGCTVHANDLNPNSYHYLVENAKRNKLSAKIKAYNLDARDFMRELVRQSVHIDHVIMNLPASAIEFLDVFCGLYAGQGTTQTGMPMIHCYCFSRAPDPIAESVEEVKSVLGVQTLETSEVFDVRDVAPRKAMLCVSFRLPEEVAFRQSELGKRVGEGSEERANKQAKAGDTAQ